MRTTSRWLRAGLVAPLLALSGCAVPGSGDAGGDPTPAPVTTGPSSAGAGSSPGGAPTPAGAGIIAALRPWLVLEPGSSLPHPRPGVTVRTTRDDPVGAGGGTTSLGLSLARGDRTLWVLAVVDDDGLHVDSERPGLSSWLTFDQWLTDTAGVERGGPGLVLADLAADGSVVPVADGARVLDQTAAPRDLMGPFRMARAQPAAVAIVRWQGHRWFVFVERRQPRNWRITVAASRIGFRADTAEELLVRWDRFGHRP